MTNDKILMNLIEAMSHLLHSTVTQRNVIERNESKEKAAHILNETMAFLKHRNPDKNAQNDAFSRQNTKE